MKTSEIIIVNPDSNTKIEALKAFLEASEIKFEITKKKAYDPNFVTEILQADEDFKNGKGKKTTLDELNSLWK